MEEQSNRSRHRVSVILSQRDRQAYPTALGRLIRLVDGLDSVEYHLAVVDNASPGDWVHRVSDRLIHAGGDEAGHQLSAFERGVSVLKALELEPDLFIFVADSFMVDDEELLELIGDHTIELAMTQDACVGRVDSFGMACRLLELEYQCWIRTSFVIMPATALDRLWPLDQGISDDEIFVDVLDGPDDDPFLDSAPLSPELRSSLLDWLTINHRSPSSKIDQWRSAFELDGSSLGLLKAEVSEALREHLMSARMLSLGIPCFDLRLASRVLGDEIARRCFRADPPQWQWLEFLNVGEAPQPRFNVEVVRLPRVITQGESSTIEISGWVVAEPQVEKVVVRTSSGGGFVVPCSLPRPDVLAAFPEFSEIQCGFELRASLADLQSGRHRLLLEISELGISTELGEIVVEPRLDFRMHGAEIEGFVSADNRLTICLDGEVQCSSPLERVDAEWEVTAGDEPARLVAITNPKPGAHRYRLKARGVVGTSRLRFTDADGIGYVWERSVATAEDSDGMARAGARGSAAMLGKPESEAAEWPSAGLGSDDDAEP